MKAAGALIGLLTLSLAGNLWLGWTVLDKAHALQDRDHEAGFTREALSNMRRLASRYGRFPGRGEAEGAMSALFAGPDDIVKWEGDTLWINEIGLAFQGDSATRVVLMNEVD